MTDPARHATSPTPPQPIAGGWRSILRTPSALALMLANLIPLYGVLVLGWAVLPIMVLFWLENIIIGVFNVIRMLLARSGPVVPLPKRLLRILFFCLHYGMFAAVHGRVVFELFADASYRSLIDGLWTFPAVQRVIADFTLWPALLALASSHLLSLVWNYLVRGEFRQARPDWLMVVPYRRVVMLHIALVLGAILIQILHSPVWALLLLIGLKIGLDVQAHLRERQRMVNTSGSVPSDNFP